MRSAGIVRASENHDPVDPDIIGTDTSFPAGGKSYIPLFRPLKPLRTPRDSR